MKKIIYLLFLFLPLIGFSQGSRLVSPMGNIISISPGITITQSSPATVFFQETINAGTLIPNKWYSLRMAFKLTTPLVSIPGLSITFQYGGSTYNLMSSTPLVGGITNGLFTINFTMLATSNNTQIPFATVTQPNGAIVTLGTSSLTPVGAFSTNSMVSNNFSVTIQFTGVALGVSKLENFWIYRDAF